MKICKQTIYFGHLNETKLKTLWQLKNLKGKGQKEDKEINAYMAQPFSLIGKRTQTESEILKTVTQNRGCRHLMAMYTMIMMILKITVTVFPLYIIT